MKIIKISPRGFCDGVINSWKLILEQKKDNPHSNIYLLGWFVHNKEFLDSLLSDNLFLLDDTNKSRFELINDNEFAENDIVILSAHGTDQKTIKLLQEKKIRYVDTTCKDVYVTHDIINKTLKKNEVVVYIGKRNHPETNSCISLSNDIELVTTLEELKKVCEKYNNQKINFFNQTTLSIYDLYEFYKYIKNHVKNYQLYNDICNATKIRQEAIMNNKNIFDLILIVGDEKSNNSQSLLKIAKTKQNNSYLINYVDQINDSWFDNVKTIGISSGASTPTWVTNNIVEYIKNKFNLTEKDIVNE